MPILKAEPNVFPADLLEPRADSDCVPPAGDGDEGRTWKVIHTLPRQEKSLVRQLRRARLPHYLPLMAQKNRIRGRVFTSHVPLFPGYVPVFINDDEWYVALETRRIVRGLPVVDQQQFVADLGRVERLLSSGMPITRESRLKPGDRVTIRNGPLRGLEGIVYRKDCTNRFVVTVDFLQKGASVVVDDFELIATG